MVLNPEKSVPSKPETPETSENHCGSHDEERAPGEPLVRKWLGIFRPPLDGLTLERAKDGTDTYPYLE